ncbi:MAG TPA: uroporphyrinogen-III C-methyltransferase [Nitrososphaeraceae archaeon]|jgi:uroporphyrin-III C-methyltransferase|nr:uroporphyrinogen-III C-methyltransferase [Thermoproteota archaeon]
MKNMGKVFLCGAGPGDPKLITVKAMELLKHCDVVLYDRLVSKDIINQIPAECEKIYVGRAVGGSTTHQDNTNIQMVKLAKQGKKVLRLKGGDPFIFGRGGEEAEFLFDNGIEFEIIPGISSAIGAAAYAGIPLTHRQYASSLAIVTGHEDENKVESIVKWDRLADAADTIVILMGIEKLEQICCNLIDAGMSRNTEIAIIENGTLKTQRVISGTLVDILHKVEYSRVKAPAIIVIGKVVTLCKKIAWFGK